MKKYDNFLSENFLFWVVEFSVYLNRRVFVMTFIHFFIQRRRLGLTDFSGNNFVQRLFVLYLLISSCYIYLYLRVISTYIFVLYLPYST